MSHDVTTEEEMEVLVTTEEEMEVLVVNDRGNDRGNKNVRGEGRFFGHVHATQSGDEEKTCLSSLLEKTFLGCRRHVAAT